MSQPDSTTQRGLIEVKAVLPGIYDPSDPCVQRFQQMLRDTSGVDAVQVVPAVGDIAGQFCIHFDSSAISLPEVRDLAARVGGLLDGRYGHFHQRIDATYASRASAIEARLSRIEGVLEVVVAPDGAVRVEFDRQLTQVSQIEAGLAEWIASDSQPPPAGASPSRDHEGAHRHAAGCQHGHSHAGIFGPHSEIIFAGLCGVGLLSGWVLQISSLGPAWLAWGGYAMAYLFGGYYPVWEAIEKIRAGKFEIDFLMIVAAAGAASLGAWAEGGLLLFLFSLGHSLEGYAMGRAKKAIEGLAELAPRVARVRRNDHEHEIPVEAVVVGDVVIVKPDERIAVDGYVLQGESSVNQAPITGESLPVDKRAVPSRPKAAEVESLASQYRVFAGSINQAGALEISVTRLASQSTLSRVVQLVSEAETRVSPTQHFTKKFERYFVPTVIAIVVLLLFAPLVVDEPFRDAFYRAMAVLVAASPCALAIATPSAVLSGVARAARGGVLIKGGGPLESLGQLDAVAFDKTGTLTVGEPRLTDVRPMAGIEESELLRIAIAVERLSNHPLAQAVVRDGQSRLDSYTRSQVVQRAGDVDVSAKPLPTAQRSQSITGRGIRAEVEGQTAFVGKDALFAEVDGPDLPAGIREVVESLERDGRTTMIVRHGEQYLGVLGVMDTPRAAAKRTIAQLRRLGIQRMIMISGDNQRVADAVAAELGLDEAYGDLMPEQKVAEIEKLQRQTGVAMVGDGVNDAPAMASASVGIAMGAAGSDIALETADVALMADNLDHLPLAIGLSRATSRIIRQNLWMSLGMVAFLVPATILGLNIGPAVVLHEGSTLVVVFNALRLLASRESNEHPSPLPPNALPQGDLSSAID